MTEPNDAAQAKPVWQSRTILANIIIVASTLLPAVQDAAQQLGATKVVAIVAAVNGVLRLITRSPVRLR